MNTTSPRRLIVPVRPLLDRLVALRGLEIRPIPPQGLEPYVLAGAGAPVPGGAVLFDVGANIGQTAGFLADNYPSSRVVAFEPVSSTHATLSQAMRGKANVECIHTGVSDAPGTLTMSATPDSQVNRVVEAPAEGVATEQVPCITLDWFAEEGGLDNVFLLKTDTEGHDVAVLAGARRLLRSSVRVVFCECGLKADDIDHTPLVDVQAFLAEFGFVLRSFYEVGYDEVGAVKFVNALFVR